MDEIPINIDKKICKEDAFNVLDRIIGFINTCDNKTSIILGIIGVMLSIFFTSDSIKELQIIIISALESSKFKDYIYLFFLVLFSICLGYGIFKLISSLFARINGLDIKEESLDLDSKIFFRHIAKNNSYKEYKQKMTKCSQEKFVNDIISQIYINSKICSKKYNDYNQGLIIISLGFVGFILTLFIGSIIY